MIKFENHLGTTELGRRYFSDLIGHTVTSCFGVAGMSSSGATQNIRGFLFRNRSYIDQGVGIEESGGELIIDLHITVSYGVNIQAVVDSVKNKVSYTVKEATGLNVKKINVFIDSMKE